MTKDKLVRTFVVAGLLGIAAALSVVSMAQPPAAQPQAAPRYDTSTETTLTGSVEAVINTTDGKGWGGTHLTLKTEKESFEVHVGPSWYLSEKQMSFVKGDPIAVTGSRVKYEGSDAVMAKEIKKGGQTLTLRDAQGIPLWSGGPGRHR